MFQQSWKWTTGWLFQENGNRWHNNYTHNTQVAMCVGPYSIVCNPSPSRPQLQFAIHLWVYAREKASHRILVCRFVRPQPKPCNHTSPLSRRVPQPLRQQLGAQTSWVFRAFRCQRKWLVATWQFRSRQPCSLGPKAHKTQLPSGPGNNEHYILHTQRD